MKCLKREPGRMIGQSLKWPLLQSHLFYAMIKRKPSPREDSQIRHGNWSLAGEIELQDEARQFLASSLYLSVWDALNIAQGKARNLGATGRVARDPALTSRYCQREKTQLLLWIGSPEFHHQCWALGFDSERYATYIFDLLRGDKVAQERFAKAASQIKQHRMVVNNGR